jgi:hypothetical protein
MVKLNFFFEKFLYFILLIFLVFFFFLINYFFAKKDINLNVTDAVNLYTYKNYSIHCTEVNIQNCVNGLNNRKNRIKIIYIGNSQLHTINNFKNNQKLISEMLFKNYINDGVDIITISLPNINLEETLWILEKQLKDVNFSFLILPLVYDDFREIGIRAELDIREIEIKKKEKIHLLFNLGIIKNNLENQKSYLLFNLYNLRNFIFGINSSTTRNVIKSSYLKNFESYEKIHYLMKKKNIKLVSYFAPVRQNPATIYSQSEYVKFKNEIIDLNIKFYTMIFDLDNIVESKNFGSIDKNNLDFMHFDYEGHIVLFNQIKNILDNEINIKNDF